MTARVTARVGVACGLTAALRAGWVVRGPALEQLLTPPAADVARAEDATAVARRATAVALVALRFLRQLPGWRNTCLYRAVAECLVLRGLGMPATLRLGVARTVGSNAVWPVAAGAIAAHAWVDCPGHRCRATDGAEASTYAALRRAAGTAG